MREVGPGSEKPRGRIIAIGFNMRGSMGVSQLRGVIGRADAIYAPSLIPA
jgi:hypothetical protein